jgi:ribosomal protein S6
MTDRKYTIKDDGKGNYTVIDHNEPEQPKEELDTNKLLAEARSLIEYNNRHKEETKQEPIIKKKEGTVQEFLRLIDTY